MTATPEQLALLASVNEQVNAIPYEATGSDSTADNWLDNPQPGVVWQCRDYATDKAKLMREQGWPLTDMGWVLCMTEVFADPSFPDKPPARYYHCVEFARAGGTIYILDNRIVPSQVVEWEPYPLDYQWVHQQTHDGSEQVTWRDASTGLV
jgi:predicted transglutaminase-like cysteine proteinase